MIFLNSKRYGVAGSSFLNEHYIAYGFFASLNTKKGLTPGDASAISKNKVSAIMKCYSEFLERYKIGVKLENNYKIPVYNYIDNNIGEEIASNFSYGYNRDYGYVDTTGTAAGPSSLDIIGIAINELIEKNEVFLFWYINCGNYVEKDDRIEYLINRRNFTSSRIEIFEVEELSNMSTFIVVCIDDNRVKASGVAINIDSNKALNKALDEARLLEWINAYNYQSELEKYDRESMLDIVDFVDKKCEVLKRYNWNFDYNNCICYKNWIKSLNIAVLNNKYDFEGIVAKCISNELFNCLPVKERILLSNNKQIIKEYGITSEDILRTPQCIVL